MKSTNSIASERKAESGAVPPLPPSQAAAAAADMIQKSNVDAEVYQYAMPKRNKHEVSFNGSGFYDDSFVNTVNDTESNLLNNSAQKNEDSRLTVLMNKALNPSSRQLDNALENAQKRKDFRIEVGEKFVSSEREIEEGPHIAVSGEEQCFEDEAEPEIDPVAAANNIIITPLNMERENGNLLLDNFIPRAELKLVSESPNFGLRVENNLHSSDVDEQEFASLSVVNNNNNSQSIGSLLAAGGHHQMLASHNPELLGSLSEFEENAFRKHSERSIKMLESEQYEQSVYDSVKEDDETEICCKICLEETEDETSGKLISPCLCQGSLGKIHEECLKTWIVSKYPDITLASCEVCKQKYQMQIEYRDECYVQNMCQEGRLSLYSSLCMLLFLFCCALLIGIFSKEYISIKDLSQDELNEHQNNILYSRTYLIIIITLLSIMFLIVSLVFYVLLVNALYVTVIETWAIFDYICDNEKSNEHSLSINSSLGQNKERKRKIFTLKSMRKPNTDLSETLAVRNARLLHFASLRREHLQRQEEQEEHREEQNFLLFNGGAHYNIGAKSCPLSPVTLESRQISQNFMQHQYPTTKNGVHLQPMLHYRHSQPSVAFEHQLENTVLLPESYLLQSQASALHLQQLNSFDPYNPEISQSASLNLLELAHSRHSKAVEEEEEEEEQKGRGFLSEEEIEESGTPSINYSQDCFEKKISEKHEVINEDEFEKLNGQPRLDRSANDSIEHSNASIEHSNGSMQEESVFSNEGEEKMYEIPKMELFESNSGREQVTEFSEEEKNIVNNNPINNNSNYESNSNNLKKKMRIQSLNEERQASIE